MTKGTLFLDMDGVIADFFTAFANFNGVVHWKDIPNKEKALESIKYTDFFFRLDEFESTKKLVDFARRYGDWGICSSPLRGDFFNSSYWKRRWLEELDYLPDVSKCIFTGNKEKYAVDQLGTPNILIDDRQDNIDKWIKKGGIGIKWQADEDNIDDLIEKLNELFSKKS